MKIAYITSYTKRGGVWDLAKDRIDYYPDAILGLIVAMRGEQIPFTWIKFKRVPRVIYHNYLAPVVSKINYAGYCKVSKWVSRNFNGFHNLKYIVKFDAVLVVVHDYSIREMAELVLAANKLRAKPLLFGVLCNTFDHFREALKNRENFSHFKDFLDNCDAFLNWGHPALSGYLRLYTDTPILNFPISYPVKFTRPFFTRCEGKKKIILISGHELRIDDIASMLVAKKIQEKHPDFLIEVVGRRSLNTEPLKGAKYKIVPFLDWEDYIKHIRKTYLIIDMDNTWTLGRVQNDAAAVGTPCIGLNAGSQIRLFPDLTCDDISGVKRAVEIGNRLIEDEKFYKRVQGRATRELEKYSCKNSAKEFERIVRGLKDEKNQPT